MIATYTNHFWLCTSYESTNHAKFIANFIENNLTKSHNLTLFMGVWNPWSLKCLLTANPLPLWLTHIEERHSGLMVPATLAIGNIQFTNYLKHWKSFFSMRIYNSTRLFLNRDLAYLWVEMHHPSLPIHTYLGVNIPMWLNLQRRIKIWQKYCHIIADIWIIYAQ